MSSEEEQYTEGGEPYAEGLEDDAEGAGLRGRLESLLPGVLRRTVASGQGARQMTEEVLRGAISDLRLPKEAVHSLLDIADATKKEVVRVAAREFREFLESARFNEELAKILTGLSLEIRTEIRFVPGGEALKPDVKSKASIHAGDGDAPIEVPSGSSLNESIRSGAQDVAELMLSRLFGRAVDAAAEAHAEESEELDEESTGDAQDEDA